jgi:hypothetical protein
MHGHTSVKCGQNVTLLNAKLYGAKLIKLYQFGYIVLHCIFVYNKLERSRTKHL